MSFAISMSGVSGPTHSTPLCMTSLTFMVELLCWVQQCLSPVPNPYVRSIYQIGPGDSRVASRFRPNGNAQGRPEFQVPSARRQVLFRIERLHIGALERTHFDE